MGEGRFAVEKMVMDFWKGRRVFLTGHTGFKGSWLSRILINAGAVLTGYSLESPDPHGLFTLSNIETRMHSVIGDIRDADALKSAYRAAAPEVVIHMAAQPIVRDSYKDPAYTYAVNVMGTVNLLECMRTIPGAISFLNVTTDKVYMNHEWVWGYRETDPLDGFDPYSNSKSCAELVTHSYKNSFWLDGTPAISTARAGNVIGGGDFSCNRIIPDCVRAALKDETIIVRNPHSVRPYQHVLEPLFAYLLILQAQYKDPKLAGWYNVGPEDKDCLTTGELVTLFCKNWEAPLRWETQTEAGPHEANFLKLDCSCLKSVFGWQPRWDIAEAVRRTVEWHQYWLDDPTSVPSVMDRQIEAFEEKTYV